MISQKNKETLLTNLVSLSGSGSQILMMSLQRTPVGRFQVQNKIFYIYRVIGPDFHQGSTDVLLVECGSLIWLVNSYNELTNLTTALKESYFEFIESSSPPSKEESPKKDYRPVVFVRASDGQEFRVGDRIKDGQGWEGVVYGLALEGSHPDDEHSNVYVGGEASIFLNHPETKIIRKG